MPRVIWGITRLLAAQCSTGPHVPQIVPMELKQSLLLAL